MKNITKKLISVLALVVIFSMVGTNVSFAKMSKTTSSSFSSNHITSNGGGQQITVPPSKTSAITGPSISSETVTNITQTTATLNGTVNPNGSSTIVSFLTLTSGLLGTVNIGSGTSDVVLAPYLLTGLTPNTNYKFKVFASNANGLIDGQWISFTTTSSSSNAPTITSETVTNITKTTATLNGTVNPNGINTLVSFFTLTSGPFGTVNIGSGNSNVVLAPYTLTNLTQGTNYKFKVFAANANGDTVDGQWVSFTTLPASGGGGNGNGGGNGGGGGGGGGGGSGSYHYASVTTQNATNITANSSILNGTIDPNGSATTAWFEYGTSSILSSINETAHANQGSGNSASAFAQSISGLAPSTTYYFRAVANNTYGTIKGNIYSFTTAIRNGTVTTVQATSKSATSAKLNGIFINPNRTQATGYFEYGKTASLGNKTADKDLGTSASVSFSNFVTGLAPNTIYFFRAVVKNQGAINNGNILVFKTSVASINLPPAEPVNIEPTVVETESSMLKITNEKDEIAIGDEINYLVSFKNTKSKNLENAKLSVQLPKEVDFVESNFGKLNSDNDLVEFNPEILLAGQIGSITIKAKVNSKAQDNNLLITTAVMSYNQEGSTETKDEIAYATNHIIAGLGLEANPLFGINFLPSTLLGWLALLLVILGLAIIGKNLYSNYAIKGNGRKTSGDIDNLPM